MSSPGRLIVTLAAFAAASLSGGEIPERAGLVVSAVSAPPDGARVAQPFGRRGPTSIRYRDQAAPKQSVSPNPTDPNGGRFHVRDRDLGQTFTVPEDSKPFLLEAVTLRVGPVAWESDGALEDARRDAPVFLQIFEVTGAPVIRDNGTTGDVVTSAAYPHDRTKAMADDYITGERYRTLLVASGGILPRDFVLGENNTGAPTARSRGTLLRFDITNAGGVRLEPGRTYAFLVGFERPGASMALPLDNWDYLNQREPAVTDADLKTGPYAGGHAIRREGRVPEPWTKPDLAFSDDPRFARFAENRTERLAQEPGTWGRPDVDTYRDLVFWISGVDLPPGAPAE